MLGSRLSCPLMTRTRTPTSSCWASLSVPTTTTFSCHRFDDCQSLRLLDARSSASTIPSSISSDSPALSASEASSSFRSWTRALQAGTRSFLLNWKLNGLRLNEIYASFIKFAFPAGFRYSIIIQSVLFAFVMLHLKQRPPVC
jgi:hypothetical protein